MADLRERVPAQALIAEILRRRDNGEVHTSSQSGMVRLTPEARPWYTGVIGERRIAERLSALREAGQSFTPFPLEGERATSIML